MKTWTLAVLLVVVFSVCQTESTIVTGQQILGRNASFGTLETGLLEVNTDGNGCGHLEQDPTASIIVHNGSHVILNGVFVQGPEAKFEYRGTSFELSSAASVIQNASSIFVMNTTKLSYDLGAYVELGEISSLEIGDNPCSGYYGNGVCSFINRVVLGFNSTVNVFDSHLFYYPEDNNNRNLNCSVNIGSNVQISIAPKSDFWLFDLGAKGGVANVGENAFFNISGNSRFYAAYSSLTVPTGYRLTLENSSGLQLEEGFSLSSLPQNLVINNSMTYNFYGYTSVSGLFSFEGNVEMILHAGSSFTADQGAKIISLLNFPFCTFVNTSGEITMDSTSQIYLTSPCDRLQIQQGGSLRMSEDSLFNISHSSSGLFLSGSVQLGNGSRLYTTGQGCMAGTIEVYGTGYASFDASSPGHYFAITGNIFVQDGGRLVAFPYTDSWHDSYCSPSKHFVLGIDASLTVSNGAKFEHSAVSTFSLGSWSRFTIGSRLNFTMEEGSGLFIGRNMHCRTINHVVLYSGIYIFVEPNMYPTEYFICF